MKVLSLFDGISCAQVAMKRAGIPVSKYYASEIDTNAIAVTQKHFPNTKQLGNCSSIDFSKIDADIIFGGFPCQDLSINTPNRQGLKGKRSGLFYVLLDAIETIQPKYVFIENVASMSSENKEIISRELGLHSIEVNSASVCAQQRKRIYWTNIPNPSFGMSKEVVKDILEPRVPSTYNIPSTFVPSQISGNPSTTIRIGNMTNLDGRITGSQYSRVYSIEGKSTCLTAEGGGWGARTGLYYVNGIVRRLTPLECERLQTLPDNYTAGFSDSARYHMIGNAWTVDLVAKFLKNIK